MESVIETRGLVKRYGDIVAVDHVSLSVPKGAFFGILGPNGAGKTTLLELIEGIREPDQGTASILGLPTWPRNVDMLPKIGVQLQSSSFFERLKVIEQLHIFADLYETPREHCEPLLATVGLTEKRNEFVQKLSGGQKQRLAIASAMVHNPDVVFLDEPTAALDPQARRNLWDLLRTINKEGRTVILTTHYMDEAETLCDEVAIMDHGKILRISRPSDMIRELTEAITITLPEGVLSTDAARQLIGIESAEQSEGILTLKTRDLTLAIEGLAQRISLNGMQVHGATLEDVFLQLTGREYRA